MVDLLGLLLLVFKLGLQARNVAAQAPDGHGVLQRRDRMGELQLLETELVLFQARAKVLLVEPLDGFQKIGFFGHGQFVLSMIRPRPSRGA